MTAYKIWDGRDGARVANDFLLEITTTVRNASYGEKGLFLTEPEMYAAAYEQTAENINPNCSRDMVEKFEDFLVRARTSGMNLETSEGREKVFRYLAANLKSPFKHFPWDAGDPAIAEEANKLADMTLDHIRKSNKTRDIYMLSDAESDASYNKQALEIMAAYLQHRDVFLNLVGLENGEAHRPVSHMKQEQSTYGFGSR